MATAAPLMPKATAVWLLDNTALSFDQIAEFCKLHPLEVKAIADGDAAQGIKGLDPILTGQLTREQIAEAEKNPDTRLKLTEPKVVGSDGRARQERPALYAGFAPPGPAERHSVAGAQSSGTQGQRDHAPRRHHQIDDCLDPRPHALEFGQSDADGPGDARPRLADRPRSRSAARQQGKAGAGRYRRDLAAGRRDHRAQGGRSRGRRRAREKAGASSTSAPCSPSSSSSAARARKEGE